jgi:hypothetical protein
MKSATLILALILAVDAFAQSDARSKKYAGQLEKLLECKQNPKPGKFLIELRRTGFISRTYTVYDTISYFKLRRPLKVWTFSPVAVFGWQGGYEKFFDRGPGTSPPEMIGIVVRESIPDVKTELQKLGVEKLEVEQAEFDLNGRTYHSKAPLTEISCREKF